MACRSADSDWVCMEGDFTAAYRATRLTRPAWASEDLAAALPEAWVWVAGMGSAMAARDSTDIRAVTAVGATEAMGTAASMAERCLTAGGMAATEPGTTRCR